MADALQPSPSENTLPEAAPIPLDPEWDEAFLRVESYLRAHYLESRVLLNRLTTEIVQQAREGARADPAQVPVVAAMHVTHARIAAWFARLGHAATEADAPEPVRGRLALVLADFPRRWADWFLSAGPIPPELQAALASGVLQVGPEVRFSNMPPAPLEFGFAAPAVPHSPGRQRWAFLRAAATWLSIVGLFGAAWAASH
jgi:hypothetical protein